LASSASCFAGELELPRLEGQVHLVGRPLHEAAAGVPPDAVAQPVGAVVVADQALGVVGGPDPDAREVLGVVAGVDLQAREVGVAVAIEVGALVKAQAAGAERDAIGVLVVDVGRACVFATIRTAPTRPTTVRTRRRRSGPSSSAWRE